MAFDILAFDTRARSETGIVMPIVNPRTRAPWRTEAGETLSITLRGRNSDAWRDAQREVSKQRAEREAANIRSTDEDFQRERATILAAVTVGWSFDTLGEQPFAFNAANAFRLWSDTRWPWLIDQAFAFVVEDSNFLAI